MDSKVNTNKIVTIVNISVISALASIIGIIDKMISMGIFSFIPGIKIGLANVIIIVVMYTKGFNSTLIVVSLKIFIVSFLFGGITTYLIGGTSSILSFLSMYIIKKISKNKLSIITISLIGGMTHIVNQLLMISLLYNIGKEILYYGIIIMIISFITSILVGVCAKKLINRDNKMQNQNI